MAGGRRKAANKSGERQPATPEAASALDVAAWSQAVLAENAAALSEDELAVIEGQLQSMAASAPPVALLPPDPTAASVVQDRKALKQVSKKLADAAEVVIDLETNSLAPRGGEIVGIGLSVADANYYVPTGHRFEESKLLRPDQLPVDVVAKELRLEQLPLVAHNAKFEFRWLRRHTGLACRFVWDVMLAARLLAAHLPADLKDLAMRELDVPDWALGKEEIERVQFLPVERVARYCAKDCYYTLELYRRQQACLV
jgi:DNA polymerase I-like protein with 3'-5' exonuclease and polymerase domains